MSQRAAEIDIFLSYKREDRAAAKALAEVLAARGYSLWWDIDLLPGDRFVDAVTEVIKRAQVTIVLWSEQAVASDYVRGEAEVARQAGKLIPARLDDCDPPIPFNALQTLDFRSWQAGGDEAPLAPLIAVLDQRLGKPTKAEQPAEQTDSKLHPRDTEATVWRSISDKHSIAEYEYYLKAYPQGVFADLAGMRIAALRKPNIGKTILKLGGIAGALAAIIGLVVLVREEFGPALDDLRSPSITAQTAVEAERLPAAEEAETAAVAEEAETAAIDTVIAAVAPNALYQPGETFRDCAECPEMVVVPAGSFMMGSPADDEDQKSDEGPQHRVTIAAPFAIGVHEVTRGEFAAFVEATGHDAGDSCYIWDGEWQLEEGRNWRSPGFSQGDDHPVVCMNWHDAQAYVAWLSGETDEAYRLLSEAEWEYAARARTITRYWPGDEITPEYANFGENVGRTIEAGSLGRPNAFGLNDVHGNVWEWVEDCWNDSYAGAPTNGTAWTSGDCGRRVLRGGSWDYNPWYLRSAIRFGRSTVLRSNNHGFRIARTLSS